MKLCARLAGAACFKFSVKAVTRMGKEEILEEGDTMSAVFLILNIWADGYERVAHIRYMDSTIDFFAGFLEYDEYIETGKSTKRKKGDKIEGSLKIELVRDFGSSDEQLSYYQNIPHSPHIEAVVDVKNVIDRFSVNVFLRDYDTPVTVEFEKQIPEQLPLRMKLCGELRLDIIDG